MPISGGIPDATIAAAAAQTPQHLIPIDQVQPGLDLDDVQGDVLIGLQKRAQRLVFFTINADVALFKAALRGVVLPRITTSTQAHANEERLAANKIAGAFGGDWKASIEMSGLNIAFTARGLQKLIPTLSAGSLPPAFTKPALEIARTCGDPLDMVDGRPSGWDPTFPRDGIDGVLNFAGSSREVVDGAWAKLRAEIEHAITEVWPDEAVGDVRPGRMRGHEHFGWRDGISQPAVRGLAEAYPGQAEVDPGAFVIGAPGGSAPAAGLEWMTNGSFMVFRKLEQDVAAFETFVQAQASQWGMDPGLLAARMVGRWKSGAPLALAPLADDEALGYDPMRNDAFDHSDDPQQRRCPYGAHTRKTNPRAEPNLAGGVGNQRIMRQGIPYGTEASLDPQGKRGLLFVCYQADLSSQFEKQQRDWANVSDFPPNKLRPPQRGGQALRPGLDPIIGQPGQPNAPVVNIYGQPGAQQQQPCGMDEPVPNYPIGNATSTLPPGAAQSYVTARATLYLFTPSMTAIAMKLSTP